MGELSALGSAVMWACSTIAMRSESGRVPALALNAFRTAFAALVVWVLVIAAGQVSELPSVPLSALSSLVGSVLIGMAIGDSLNIRAMYAIGVARALPISSTYPILTALLAVVWLGEPLTPRIGAGILLVVAGVALVAFPRRPPRLVAAPETAVKPVAARAGIAMAAGASLCWSFSTVIVRPALDYVDPLMANAVRLPIAFLVLALMSAGSTRGTSNPFAVGRRSAGVLALAGTFSGISGAFWLFGVRYAGAAKAATLSSTAPIFAAPLAVLFLGERLSLQIGVGILLTVAGIWLVL